MRYSEWLFPIQAYIRQRCDVSGGVALLSSVLTVLLMVLVWLATTVAGTHVSISYLAPLPPFHQLVQDWVVVYLSYYWPDIARVALRLSFMSAGVLLSVGVATVPLCLIRLAKRQPVPVWRVAKFILLGGRTLLPIGVVAVYMLETDIWRVPSASVLLVVAFQSVIGLVMGGAMVVMTAMQAVRAAAGACEDARHMPAIGSSAEMINHASGPPTAHRSPSLAEWLVPVRKYARLATLPSRLRVSLVFIATTCSMTVIAIVFQYGWRDPMSYAFLADSSFLGHVLLLLPCVALTLAALCGLTRTLSNGLLDCRPAIGDAAGLAALWRFSVLSSQTWAMLLTVVWLILSVLSDKFLLGLFLLLWLVAGGSVLALTALVVPNWYARHRKSVPSAIMALCLPCPVVPLIVMHWLARQQSEAAEKHRDSSRCSQCGYLLIGLTEPRCPECGTVFDPAKLEHLAIGGVYADTKE